MHLIETIKVVDGKAENLDYHARRVWHSSRALFGAAVNLPFEQLPIEQVVGRHKLRIMWSENGLKEWSLTPYTLPVIGALHPVFVENVSFYTHKFADRTTLDRLKADARSEIIICNPNGMLTDTSFSNIVLEDANGRLFTPQTCLLCGTKRQLYLDQQRITTRSITLDDLPLYRHIWLVNGMLDLEDRVGGEVGSICTF